MNMPNHQARAHLLMCRPDHFAVSYAINPWMDPPSWARDRRAHAAAVGEWASLHRQFVKLGATIEHVTPAPGLPDLVFTANAAVVLDRRVLLARFRHPERRRVPLTDSRRHPMQRSRFRPAVALAAAATLLATLVPATPAAAANATFRAGTLKVAEAMADKYWSDVLIRWVDHPLTARLEPEPGM